MALLTLTVPLSSLSIHASSTSSSSPSHFSSSWFPPKFSSSNLALFPLGVNRFQRHLVRMAPEEEKMTRRSPLDFPIPTKVGPVDKELAHTRSLQESPKPGRRPDIFPQFSPMKTPLPPPLPCDPPEEDEEEEEKKEEEEEDPDKEETDKPDQQQ
ncbi:hypothetical protein RIF29_28143 [Crotalaria pallida]|uniref:Uncharacterized protein n=1 Tax=Crotalaria pallida TaxID=3830 RepID=A0AAN9EQV9_CROPI